jgi:hypothetical protein
MKFLKYFEDNLDSNILVETEPNGEGILLTKYDFGEGTWYNANKKLNELRERYKYWRLPTISELRKIFQYYPERLRVYGYWSSSEEEIYAWWLNSRSGDFFISSKDRHYGVLFVRDVKNYEIQAAKYNL